MQWHFSWKCLPSFSFWHEENKGFPTPERISMKYAHQSPCKESLCHRIVLTWRSRQWMNRMVCSPLIALFRKTHIFSGSSFVLDVPVGLWPWVSQQSKSQQCGEVMSLYSVRLPPSFFKSCAPFGSELLKMGFGFHISLSESLSLALFLLPVITVVLICGPQIGGVRYTGFRIVPQIYWTSFSEDSAGTCVFTSLPGDSDACSSGNHCFIKCMC